MGGLGILFMRCLMGGFRLTRGRDYSGGKWTAQLLCSGGMYPSRTVARSGDTASHASSPGRSPAPSSLRPEETDSDVCESFLILFRCFQHFLFRRHFFSTSKLLYFRFTNGGKDFVNSKKRIVKKLL